MPATLIASSACRSRMTNGPATAAAAPMAVDAEKPATIDVHVAPPRSDFEKACSKKNARATRDALAAPLKSLSLASSPARAPGRRARKPRVRAIVEQIGSGAFPASSVSSTSRCGCVPAVGQQMVDRNAALRQPARHQHGAMAVERLLLGAHQAERGVRRRAAIRRPSASLKSGRAASCVVARRRLPGLPPSAAPSWTVGDAGHGRATLGQALLAELREAARVGHRRARRPAASTPPAFRRSTKRSMGWY